MFNIKPEDRRYKIKPMYEIEKELYYIEKQILEYEELDNKILGLRQKKRDLKNAIYNIYQSIGIDNEKK